MALMTDVALCLLGITLRVFGLALLVWLIFADLTWRESLAAVGFALAFMHVGRVVMRWNVQSEEE